MAEQPTNRHETTAPQNPPQSVVNRSVRRVALRTYLGVIVVFFALVAALFLAMRSGSKQDTGFRGMSHEERPGGHPTEPAFGSTDDELKYRGTAGRNLN